jgi:hypothetical protein
LGPTPTSGTVTGTLAAALLAAETGALGSTVRISWASVGWNPNMVALSTAKRLKDFKNTRRMATSGAEFF